MRALRCDFNASQLPDENRLRIALEEGLVSAELLECSIIFTKYKILLSAIGFADDKTASKRMTTAIEYSCYPLVREL